MSKRTRQESEVERPRRISIAIILFALVAILFGMLDPVGLRQGKVSEPILVQRQDDRADSAAGFAVPQHPEETPRGPEP